MVELKESLSDKVAKAVGSWKFINTQAGLMIFWITWNTNAPEGVRFDPYPFILLNLFMSGEAAFTAPAIMMASNKAAALDRNTFTEDKNIDSESLEILKWMKEKLSDGTH